jgi:hypothetical protein
MFAVALIAASLAAPPVVPAPDVRETIRDGLKWLAEHQTKDGYWAGRANTSKTMPTAYAGLALLMQGSTLSEGPYAANLRTAVAWIEKNAQPNGSLLAADDPAERSQTMANHSAALLFLASAYHADEDEPRRKRLGKLLDAAVKFTADAQAKSGGWGIQPVPAGTRDTATTRTTTSVLQSLYAARRSGIGVPREVTDRAVKYLEACTNADGALILSLRTATASRRDDSRPPETAVAAATALTSGEQKRPAVAGWVEYTRTHPPFVLAEDFPQPLARLGAVVLQHHLHVALTANALGEDGHRYLAPEARESELLRWSDYRRRVFGYLKVAQNIDGTWPDATAGPAHATALALIILQLDNNYIPAFSR